MASKHQVHWLRGVCVAFFGVAFLLSAGRTGKAQEPEKQSSEVQQLREKLQKLEQTVQELKTQLANLEQPRVHGPLVGPGHQEAAIALLLGLLQPDAGRASLSARARSVRDSGHPRELGRRDHVVLRVGPGPSRIFLGRSGRQFQT